MEIWKDIPSYEGHYQVSNLGNVKSIKYSRQRILKPATNIHGYFMVCLHVKNTQKLITIHSLVSMAFLNHKPNKTHEIVIDHINNLKTDNRLENLRWDTRKNNHADKILHGTEQRGSKNGNAKVTEEIALLAKYGKDSLSNLASKFQLSKSTLSNIRYGQTWKHL